MVLPNIVICNGLNTFTHETMKIFVFILSVSYDKGTATMKEKMYAGNPHFYSPENRIESRQGLQVCNCTNIQFLPPKFSPFYWRGRAG